MGKEKKNFGSRFGRSENSENSENSVKSEEPKKEAKKSTAVPPKMIRLPNGSVVQVNK